MNFGILNPHLCKSTSCSVYSCTLVCKQPTDIPLKYYSSALALQDAFKPVLTGLSLSNPLQGAGNISALSIFVFWLQASLQQYTPNGFIRTADAGVYLVRGISV